MNHQKKLLIEIKIIALFSIILQIHNILLQKIGIKWKFELFDGNQSAKEENIN